MLPSSPGWPGWPWPSVLQFAPRDEFISRWDAEAYAQAVTAPKQVGWYPTDHFALGDASREARLRWLAALLAP